jgi:hypothetical protein
MVLWKFIRYLASMKIGFGILGFMLTFLSQAQSIDVYVEGTNYEFSGDVYEVNTSSSFDVFVDLVVKNNTDSLQNWKIERILPAVQHWDDHTMSWSIYSDPLGGYCYVVWPTLSWITQAAISVPTSDSVNIRLNYESISDGCDLYLYYVLHNDVRVDSFSIHLCKTLGLNEVSKNSVEMYPIPANFELNLRFPDVVPTEIEIVDLLGNKLKTFEASSDMKISTEKLSNGIYFVTGILDGEYFSRTFQVQH